MAIYKIKYDFNYKIKLKTNRDSRWYNISSKKEVLRP
jgi:hypothetical protein